MAIIVFVVILILAFAVSGFAGAPQAPICSGCNIGGCMQISATDIAQYARNAGFDGCSLTIAVAIALAESGGNTRAYNPEAKARGGTPQGLGSYGLWQIYEKQHPEFQGEDLFDPQKNAQAAFDVFSATGSFEPWATFDPRDGTTPRYLSFLNEATQAVNS